jgi:cardiolipin synthase
MRVFDIGAKDEPAEVSDRILTVPNLLSLLRVLVLPWVFVELVRGHWMSAFWWLAVFTATDWFDGYIARRFDQVTRFGQMLDPISDRLLVAVVGIGMVVADLVPWWVIGALLLRDAVVVAGGTYLMARQRPPLAVTRLGKAATFGLMFALPSFVLAAGLGDGPADPQAAWWAIAWITWAVNTVLYYAAAGQYAAQGWRSLHEAVPPTSPTSPRPGDPAGR